MSEEHVTTAAGLHPHYCNICEGDWDHDGACEEGAVACCPWCFPIADAAPVPGARRGPHFHFCPECTQNWQHHEPCAAPLRVVLPDCTGCREPSGGRSRGFSSSPPDVSRPVSGPVSRRDFVRRARVLRKVVVPATIAAGVIVALPLLVLTSSFFWSRAPRDVARVPEPPSSEIPPALPAPPLPRAPEEPLSIEAQARLQREGERREGRPAPATEQLAARIAPALPAPLPPRAPEEPLSIEAQARLQREGERREGRPAPATEQLAARIAPPSEATVAPKSTGPANPPGSPGRENSRITPSPTAPPPAPAREAIAEVVPRAPEVPPTPPSESVTAVLPGPTPTVASVPGALSQGGGAALDALLPGPRRFGRTSPPRSDLPEWSSESPRWARAAISVLMRAVVDIRPSQRREVQPPPRRGFIVDELGHILTSDHRLGDATLYEVTLSDGRTLGATVVARDRLNGIAVLRLARRGAPAIPLGESAALAVGDRVLAISSETGADRTPAAATVLATGAGTGGNLAIDLTPMPEGVGGPLLNHLGAAIGILIESAPSAASQRRLTFAVPIDRVKALLRNARPRPMADLLGVPEGR